MGESDQITQLSIRSLLSRNDEYVIAVYQRNYAWEEEEITQLIQDVIDYLPGEGAAGRNYYIGSLVVYERPNTKTPVFETIDGQQRLTTLMLLMSFLKNSKAAHVDWYTHLGIDFDSREQSRATFAAIFEGRYKDDPAEVLDPDHINTGILNGYRLIRKLLPLKLKEGGVSAQQFANYLSDNVQILRVKVPPDTDLNHYFEIMNNRGEQLEKHEVLKARMMEKLKDCKKSQECLHLVWEACANMERYVQMGFTPDQRNAIFGKHDWGNFVPDGFDNLADLQKCNSESASREGTPLTLDQIIAKPPLAVDQKGAGEESPERFNTVINFPNFLLHVLRVTTEKDIPLDDKRLLESFETYVLKQADPVAAVKKFAFSLLRCKYLFDRYVIKREFIKGSDGWSLKRFKWNKGGQENDSGRGSYVNTFGEEDESGGINRQILMLLSAFHVSTPTMVYKHWLNAVMFYLYNSKHVAATEYLQHLESVATAFVFDRFLAEGDGLDYYSIIYSNNGVCQSRNERVMGESLEPRLSYGAIRNNLVFNFLDYLLWLKYQSDGKVKNFEFTFRSSVEHYYPRKPISGDVLLDDRILNSFGNLCLISHEKNSRLNNYMPVAKRDHYRNSSIDSVKQFLMMKVEPWDAAAISEHYQQMVQVLLGCLSASHEGKLSGSVLTS